MGHLIRVGLCKGWPFCRSRNVFAARWVVGEPVESVYEAQHVRHCNVGDREITGEPLPRIQHGLHVSKACGKKRIKASSAWGLLLVIGSFEYEPRQSGHFDAVERRQYPFYDVKAPVNVSWH